MLTCKRFGRLWGTMQHLADQEHTVHVVHQPTQRPLASGLYVFIQAKRMFGPVSMTYLCWAGKGMVSTTRISLFSDCYFGVAVSVTSTFIDSYLSNCNDIFAYICDIYHLSYLWHISLKLLVTYITPVTKSVWISGLVPGREVELRNGKKVIKPTRLPRDWTADQLRRYVLRSFPKVLTFKYMRGKPNSTEMIPLPDHLKPSMFGQLVNRSKLYIVPTSVQVLCMFVIDMVHDMKLFID